MAIATTMKAVTMMSETTRARLVRILLWFGVVCVTIDALATEPSSVSSGRNSNVGKVVLWTSGTCPYAQRAWIALLEKGVNFEHRRVDLANKEATPDFLEAYRMANPNALSSAKVPVVAIDTVDNNVSNDDQTTTIKTDYYTESKIVCEVLEEFFPPSSSTCSLMPGTVQDRYRQRVFADAVYDSIFGGDRSPYQLALRKVESESSSENDNGNVSAWNEEEFQETLCTMLENLNESLREFSMPSGVSTASDVGPFLQGHTFGMAECWTAPFVQRADFMLRYKLGTDVATVCQEKGYDRAGQWWQAVLNRPSVVQSAAPDPKAGADRILAMLAKRRAAMTTTNK